MNTPFIKHLPLKVPLEQEERKKRNSEPYACVFVCSMGCERCGDEWKTFFHPFRITLHWAFDHSMTAAASPIFHPVIRTQESEREDAERVRHRQLAINSINIY